MTLTAQMTKEKKTNKLNLIKIKILCSKAHHQENEKDNLQNGENTCKMSMSRIYDKGVVASI